MVSKTSIGEPAIPSGLDASHVSRPFPGGHRRNHMTHAPDSPGQPTTQRPGGTGARGRFALSRWDLGFLVSVLVVLLGSIVPLATSRFGLNVWGVYNPFFLGIGVLMPLAAAGLVLARATGSTGSAGGGPRLGSLNAAQFAHVASWLALAFFFVTFATTLDPVLVIGLVGSLGLVATSPLRNLVAGLADSRAASRPATPAAGHQRGPATAGAAQAPTSAEAPAAGGRVPDDARPEGTDRGADHEVASTGAAPAYGQAATGEAHEEFRTSPEGAEPTGDAQPQDIRLSGADADEQWGDTRLHPRSTDEAAASATSAFGAPGIDTDDTDDTDDTTNTAADRGAAPGQDTGTGADPQPAPVQHTEVLEPQATAPSAPRGAEPVEYEAFWFAVGTHRMAVHPEDGSPAFGLEPGGWILALEDRGHEFLVQNTDGRTGVLRDLTDIERA
jgi:hypothetical protein